MATPWDQRFFTNKRGQIISLLRQANRTVEELAKALGLTNSGVRTHLAVLERDRIVRQRGTVSSSSGGKPAHLYELTPEAEDLFSKAYKPMLRELLAILA